MPRGGCSVGSTAANRMFAPRGPGRRLPLASVGIAVAVTLIGCGPQDDSGRAPTATNTTTAPAATNTTTSTTTTTHSPLYECQSPVWIEGAKAMAKKGLCLDDTTFWHCPDKMPGTWPNVKGDSVGSLRLFKPWHPQWGDDKARQRAWNSMKAWLEANNGQVLLGTEVTCDSAADDQMWQWSLEMIKFLGKDRIKGVAVGNEMDVYFRGKPQACIAELWSTRYWETLQARVADVDKLGMTDTPITIVWAMSVLAAKPWKENGEAKVNSLVTKAYRKWGRRFVWSFNVYGIWDRGAYPSGPGDCKDKTAAATHITYTKSILKEARRRIKMTTGNDDDIMWVGENGWSSPMPQAHRAFPFCPDYDSLSTFRAAYESFLTWDLTLDDGFKGPDHAFFFTMRDAHNGGASEYFGLVRTCADTTCKISKPGGAASSDALGANATRAWVTV